MARIGRYFALTCNTTSLFYINRRYWTSSGQLRANHDELLWASGRVLWTAHAVCGPRHTACGLRKRVQVGKWILVPYLLLPTLAIFPTPPAHAAASEHVMGLRPRGAFENSPVIYHWVVGSKRCTVSPVGTTDELSDSKSSIVPPGLGNIVDFLPSSLIAPRTPGGLRTTAWGDRCNTLQHFATLFAFSPAFLGPIVGADGRTSRDNSIVKEQVNRILPEGVTHVNRYCVIFINIYT